MRGHQVELASGEGLQISTGISIFGQIIRLMRRLGKSIEDTLDIGFGSAGDDDLQPRSLCSGIGQGLQETWATLSTATLVKCVNDKDERVFRVVLGYRLRLAAPSG